MIRGKTKFDILLFARTPKGSETQIEIPRGRLNKTQLEHARHLSQRILSLPNYKRKPLTPRQREILQELLEVEVPESSKRVLCWEGVGSHVVKGGYRYIAARGSTISALVDRGLLEYVPMTGGGYWRLP